MKRLLKLTSSEKVLLYLLYHLKDKEMPEKIYYFTQEAIAKYSKISLKHIARIVDPLKKAKLIREEKSTVPGKERKRKVYFLTTRGVKEARELVKELKEEEITLQEGEDFRRVKLKDINKLLKIRASVLDIVTAIEENGILRKEELLEHLPKVKRGYVHHLEMTPLKYFFGRKRELAELDEVLKEYEFIIIRGIAGIGKTTLAKKFALNLRDSHDLLWYDIHRWTTLHGVVEAIGNFLSDLGYSQLIDFLRQNRNFTVEDVESVLKRFIDRCEGVLFFDDVEKASSSIMEFFAMLLRLVESKRGIKVVMCARFIPEPVFYDRRDVLTRKLVYEFQLEGLDFEGCKELLQSRNITMSTEELQHLWNKLGGHPLFFEIIQSSANIEEISKNEENIGKYLYQEIYKSLSEGERKVMNYFSVFRHPVNGNVLFFDKGITVETIENLRDRSLIVPEKENLYETHDVIKEFFYTQLNPVQRKMYHKKAVSVYETYHPEFALTETSYHLIKSEDYQEAVWHLFNNKAELISEGKLDELSNQLKMIPEKSLEGRTYTAYLMLLSEVRYAKGNWDEAIQLLNTLLKYKDELETSYLTNIYRTLGNIHKEKADWDNALLYFDKAFALALSIMDEKTIAEIYAGRGFVHFRMGEHKEAIEENLKCIKIAKKIGDINLEVSASIIIAMSHVNLGDYDKAISYYHHCLDLLRESQDLYTKCRVLNNLGVAYYMKEENELALESWERCIQLAKKSGNKKRESYALFNSADLYAKKGEWKKAKEYLDKARLILQEMGDKPGLAYVYMNYGIYYKTRREWDRSIYYFEESIKLAKEMDTPIDLAERYVELGLMYKEKGDYKLAKEEFQKALEIYKEVGGKEKILRRIMDEMEDMEKKEEKE